MSSESQKKPVPSQRLLNMEAGMRDLEQLLLDIIQEGIGSAPNRPLAFWEERAARLVDAQLRPIASRLKKMPFFFSQYEEWADAFLEELAELYMMVKMFNKRDSLDPSVIAELYAGAGLTARKSDLDESKAISGHWELVGQFSGADDQLKYLKTWWYSRTLKEFFFQLDFAFGSQLLPDNLKVGRVYEGRLLPYEGCAPRRAFLLPEEKATGFVNNLTGMSSFPNVSEAFTQALKRNPLLKDLPVILTGVKPVVLEGKVVLLDESALVMEVSDNQKQGESLFVISGGNPVNLFGEWNGALFNPYSVEIENHFLSLNR